MNRARRGIAYWQLAPALILFLAGCQTTPRRASQVDDRIAFYAARSQGPSTYPAYAQLGLAYLEKYRATGNTEYHAAALHALEQSLTYQPNFEAFLGMALTLSERHQFREALPYAQDAVAAMPSSLEALGALFDIQLALGRADNAAETLDRARAAATDFQVLSRRAALCEYHGDLVEALTAMQEAREAAPAPPLRLRAWADVRIGALHVALCQPDEAHASYERALELVPDYFFANEHLAEWYAAQGQWKRAEDLFRHILKVHPNTQYRRGLAEAIMQLGRTNVARELLQTVEADYRLAISRGAQDQFRPLALLLLENPTTVSEGLAFAQHDWQVRQDALAADTLAWAHFLNNEPQAALALARQAVETGSAHPSVRLHCGMIFARAGEADRGIELIKLALACPLTFGPHERTLVGQAKACIEARPNRVK